METTIKIDGVSVRFKKTGGTAVRYLERTGRELNADLSKFFEAVAEVDKIGDKLKKGLALMRMETGWMYDFLYVMAKQADPTVPNMVEWLDSFDDFDAQAAMIELIPMLRKEAQVSPKNG